MAKKFILADNVFKMSAAIDYHSEMVNDRSTTKGGGRWHMDTDNKILYLWDQSCDFGPANPKNIKEYLSRSVIMRLVGYKVMFSEYLSVNLPELDKFTELCTIEE